MIALNWDGGIGPDWRPKYSGPTPPEDATPNHGDAWWNTATGALYVWTGDGWFNLDDVPPQPERSPGEAAFWNRWRNRQAHWEGHTHR